uniref:GAP family protein n=1 Tax=Mycobacterium sp. TaxID=1785 RepID=UPI0031D51195
QGSLPVVWSMVLGLGILTGLDPVRIGVTLLVASRSRPLQNLITYWVGAVIAGVSYMLILLTFLHVVPFVRTFAHDLATPASFARSIIRHVQFGTGVLALSAAAFMAVRFWARRREQVLAPSGATSTRVMASSGPTMIGPPPDRAQPEPAKGKSAVWRGFGRARTAWDGGSLWIVLVMGLLAVPPPVTVLLVLTTIVGRGAEVAAQVSAAIVFIVGVLVVAELTLVSHLAAPVQTQAVLRRVHDWALAQRRKILLTLCTVIGVAMLVQGMGRP